MSDVSPDDLEMARRKLTLLNSDWTVMFLRQLVEENPDMTVTHALRLARIALLEQRVELEGATPELLARLQYQRDLK